MAPAWLGADGIFGSYWASSVSDTSHTREVLGKVLDYSPERIDALVQEGAIRCGDEPA
jgi:hypothetical protein